METLITDFSIVETATNTLAITGRWVIAALSHKISDLVKIMINVDADSNRGGGKMHCVNWCPHSKNLYAVFCKNMYSTVSEPTLDIKCF